jgi:hypothetical protein
MKKLDILYINKKKYYFFWAPLFLIPPHVFQIVNRKKSGKLINKNRFIGMKRINGLRKRNRRPGKKKTNFVETKNLI